MMQSVNKLVGIVTGQKERRPGHEICRNCGVSVVFHENQWRQRCPACGITITIPQNKVIRITKNKPPACFACYDTGLIHYQAQENEHLYDYMARCLCETGKNRREAFPTAEEVKDHMPVLQWLVQKNRKDWEKKYGKINEPALIEGAVDVDTVKVPFNAK